MIHVLIERQIADDMLSTYEIHCKKALQQSYVEHGFISGEVFTDINDANHQFVFCKWRTEQDWNRWYTSDDRLDIMNHINPILVHPERVSLIKN